MMPLIRRAPDQDALDADVVLVTFGLLFVFQGLALVNWSGDLRGYSFLSVAGAYRRRNGGAEPARWPSSAPACWRWRCSWCCAIRASAAALRAITIDPVAASLVGVDVRRYSALAFAAGGALAAAAGMLVSTFISFSATTGVEYTLKALIVVIMAGVGRVTGTLAAGLLLGVVESLGGYLLDPALTIAINFACSCWCCCCGRRGCSPVLELAATRPGRSWRSRAGGARAGAAAARSSLAT